MKGNFSVRSLFKFFNLGGVKSSLARIICVSKFLSNRTFLWLVSENVILTFKVGNGPCGVVFKQAQA